VNFKRETKTWKVRKGKLLRRRKARTTADLLILYAFYHQSSAG
jgi:acyl-CoA-binding protein